MGNLEYFSSKFTINRSKTIMKKIFNIIILIICKYTSELRIALFDKNNWYGIDLVIPTNIITRKNSSCPFSVPWKFIGTHCVNADKNGSCLIFKNMDNMNEDKSKSSSLNQFKYMQISCCKRLIGWSKLDLYPS